MKIRQLTGTMGAELSDVRLISGDSAMADEFVGLLDELKVVVIRDQQSLDSAPLLRFAEHLGDVERAAYPQHPATLLVRSA